MKLHVKPKFTLFLHVLLHTSSLSCMSIDSRSIVDVVYCLNCRQDTSDFAAYNACRLGITTLAQLVCVGSQSTPEKRKLWSVCIVDVEVVRVGINRCCVRILCSFRNSYEIEFSSFVEILAFETVVAQLL